MKKLLVTAVLLVTSLLCAVSHAASDKPNVMFIVVDDLAPTLGTYGVPQVVSPNIDALAAKSTQFNFSYVQVAVCGPSRTSFLTGLRPDASQVWTIGPYFRNVAQGQGSHVKSLPQWLRVEGGYNTTGVGKIWHPGTPSGGLIKTTGGFDQCPLVSGVNDCQWDGPSSDPSDPLSVASWTIPHCAGDQFTNDTMQSPLMQQWPCANASWPSCGGGLVQDDACIQCFTDCGTWGNSGPTYAGCDCPAWCYPEGLVANHTIAALEAYQANPDKSFAMFVGMKRPHLVYRAPQKWFDMYNLDDVELPVHPDPPPSMPPIAYGHTCISTPNSKCQDEQSSDGALEYELQANDTEVRELRRAYYAVATFMDDQLGRILDYLDSSGLANNTIISFIGDHGYQNGQRAEWCKSNTNELATRIPMFVHAPPSLDAKLGTASSRGRQVDTPVEAIDLYPTLLELAGIESPPQRLGGESLVSLMKGETGARKKAWALSQWPRRPSCATHHSCGDGSGDPFDFLPDQAVMGYSLRTSEYRYTEWREFDWATNLPTNVTVAVELYDHTDDKGDNYAREHADWDNLALLPNMSSVVKTLHAQLDPIIADAGLPPMQTRPNPVCSYALSGSPSLCLSASNDVNRLPTSANVSLAACGDGDGDGGVGVVVGAAAPVDWSLRPEGGFDSPKGVSQVEAVSRGGLCLTAESDTAVALRPCQLPAVSNEFKTHFAFDKTTGRFESKDVPGYCVAASATSGGGTVGLGPCASAASWIAKC